MDATSHCGAIGKFPLPSTDLGLVGFEPRMRWEAYALARPRVGIVPTNHQKPGGIFGTCVICIAT